MRRTDIGRRDRNGNPAWLDEPAARSLARVDAQLGDPVQVTWAGRTRAEQQYLWDKYGHNPAKAARPGTSPHEAGNAIDSDEAQKHLDVMHDHGWRRPLKSEPWHFVYWPQHDNHHGEEPDMALNADTDYPAFRDMLFRALKWDIRTDGAGPDWNLGPTIWERLNQVQAAASTGTVIDSKAAAEQIAAAIPGDIAEQVAAALAKRLQE